MSFEQQLPSLSGKTIVVAGGTGGIGRPLAQLLHSLGAKVHHAGRDRTACQAVVPGAAIAYTPLDAEDGAKTPYQPAPAPDNQVHGLFYCVGSNASALASMARTLEATPHEDRRRDLALHVTGLTAAVYTFRHLLTRDSAVIVVGSLVTQAQLPMSSYKHAKMQQESAVQELRSDSVLQKKGVRVHLARVGMADTAMNRAVAPGIPGIPCDQIARSLVGLLGSPVHSTIAIAHSQT